MRLQALDTMHVSAVKSDSLRPGEAFDISDAAGADLLKVHPTKFKRLAEEAVKAEPKAKTKAEAGASEMKIEKQSETKAEVKPQNAAEGAAPANAAEGSAPVNAAEGAAPQNKAEVAAPANKANEGKGVSKK